MKHTNNGNCWKPAYRCKECGKGELCDVCHKHDAPPRSHERHQQAYIR